MNGRRVFDLSPQISRATGELVTASRLLWMAGLLLALVAVMVLVG
jgi:hypothetical protein